MPDAGKPSSSLYADRTLNRLYFNTISDRKSVRVGTPCSVHILRWTCIARERRA